MKAKIQKASDRSYVENENKVIERDISTLEELVEIMKKEESDLILSINGEDSEVLEVTIYDDYVE